MPTFSRFTTAPTPAGLKKWNLWLAIVQLAEAAAILALSTTKTVPVHLSMLTTDSLQSVTSGGLVLAPATHHLFNVNLAYLIAAYFILSALGCLSMMSWYRRRYEVDLRERVNRFRWVEYSLSASLMLVTIALICGMYDGVSLLFVFGVGVIMHLLFWLTERIAQQRGAGARLWQGGYGLGFALGCLAWLAIVVYVLATNVFGSGSLPGYVYGIVISLGIICAGLGANLWLQLSRRGPWKNYLFGERTFMIITFIAKTALAWQVFAGVLKP